MFSPKHILWGPHRRRASVRLGLLGLTALWASVWAPSTAAQESAFSSHDLAPEPAWQALQGSRAATGGDLSSPQGNPAAAALFPQAAVSFSHLSWPGGLSREWAGTILPLAPRWNLAAAAGLLRSDVLPAFDADGLQIGTLQPVEWNAGAALARVMGSSYAIGIGARFFRLEDPSAPLSAAAVSAGLLWNGASRRGGFSVTDAGPAAVSSARQYPLPTRVRMGFEQEFGQGRWLGAMTLEGEPGIGRVRLRFGFVARPLPWLELMSGVSAGEDVGESGASRWSAGARLTQGDFAFSYAYGSSAALEASHQFGLGFRLPERSGLGREAEDTEAGTGDTSGPAGAQAVLVTQRGAERVAIERAVSAGNPVKDTATAVPPVLPPAPSTGEAAASSAPGPVSGVGVWGGLYRSEGAARAEIDLLAREGCPTARAVAVSSGGCRVLARLCLDSREADEVVRRMKARAILLTTGPIPPIAP